MTVYVPRGFSTRDDLVGMGYSISEAHAPNVTRVGLLNLMPDKAATERQFVQTIAKHSCDVELVPMRFTSHQSKNCSRYYLEKVYQPITPDTVKSLDGLIVTGAPVELLDFEDIDYWREFSELLKCIRQANVSTLFICWSAQAALNYYFGIPIQKLDTKLFGVYPQTVLNPHHNLTLGLGAEFLAPVARYTTVSARDVEYNAHLETLAQCPVTGPALVADNHHNLTFMFNHLEYEPDSLHREYIRDISVRENAQRPSYYYCDYQIDFPQNHWEDASTAFFSNWLSGVEYATGSRKLALHSHAIAA